LLNVLAHELQLAVNGRQLDPAAVFQAVAGVHRRCRGAYAVVAMIAGFGLLAFRDPYGIRPIVFGKAETDKGTEYLVASESVALDTLGFELVRDVDPGEAILIDADGNFYSQQCAQSASLNPCIFEYVYLARPDSQIDGISVYQTRLNMGESLAEKVKRGYRHLDIDVVIPIPDSSRPAAMQMANRLSLPYREGFIKNRYIGRTFIMPGQAVRRKSVRQKLNAIGQEFKGKNVLLVDDSIVRGTTSREIVQMARECGARKVFFASAAPPVRFPNVYGIDMPTRSELIATGRDEAQIAEAIGADAVLYQDLASLIADVRACNPAIERFDCSCFDGDYITGDVSPDYLAGIEATRHDGESSGTRLSSYQLDLGLTAVD
jgi:amidophosphoribosyltransferase